MTSLKIEYSKFKAVSHTELIHKAQDITLKITGTCCGFCFVLFFKSFTQVIPQSNFVNVKDLR